MPKIALRASDREERRPRPIPKNVQMACRLMIYGDPAAGDDAVPLSFVQAAAIAQIPAHRMRQWLDRPRVIQFIRAERAIFRRALCAGNELALARIRDHGENAAASVRASLALEAIDSAAAIASRGAASSPGITIRIIQPPAPAIEPKHVEAIEHAERVDAEVVFNPNAPVLDDDR
jgi:hypothetical protein